MGRGHTADGHVDDRRTFAWNRLAGNAAEEHGQVGCALDRLGCERERLGNRRVERGREVDECQVVPVDDADLGARSVVIYDQNAGAVIEEIEI